MLSTSSAEAKEGREAVAYPPLGDLFQALPHGTIVARLVQVAIDQAVQKYGRTGTSASFQSPQERREFTSWPEALA